MVGHTSTLETYEILSRRYFSVHMREDITWFIHNCHTCSRAKSSDQMTPGLLHLLKIPSNAWEEVSMDFVSGLPKSKSGNNDVLIVVNRLSKMRHFIPCSTKN
jgi:hypothetical protein